MNDGARPATDRPRASTTGAEPAAGEAAAASAAPAAPLSPRETWREALFNRRMLICVFTGFSSGLPLYLLLNLLPAWLRSEGVDLKTIGFFALIQLPYTWKFLWSPLIDRYALPVMGRRRGWMLATQLLLLVSIPVFGLLQPQNDIWAIVYLSTAVAFFSACAGHRPRRLSARDPARRRARPRHVDPRQRVPHIEPHPRRAGADPRRPDAVVGRLLHHRAVHAAGHRDDARGRRARAGEGAPANAARGGRRAVSRVRHAQRRARRAARAAVHLPLQARRQHGDRAGDAVLPRHGVHQDRHRRDRQERRPVGERAGRPAGRPVDGEDRHQPRVVDLRCRAARVDPGLRLACVGQPPRQAAARGGDRLRGARRGAGHGGVHRVHRAGDRPALHGDAVRAVHQPRRRAAHADQRDDGLPRRTARLVRFLPVVHSAGDPRHGTTLACRALARAFTRRRRPEANEVRRTKAATIPRRSTGRNSARSRIAITTT